MTGVVGSAAAFGLTSPELLAAFMATPDLLPLDLRASYIDQLTKELARRLLEKQRVAP